MLENIGKYEIREKIGEGGQASVYIGHDTVLDSRVAIKIINPNSQNKSILFLYLRLKKDQVEV